MTRRVWQERRNRLPRQCSRPGCGRIAAYQSAAHVRYCPEHAADICAHVVLHPIEGYDQPTPDVLEVTHAIR